MDRPVDTETPPSPAPRSRFRTGIIAAGAAVGMTLAGLGVAAAQTDDGAPSPNGEITAPGPRMETMRHRPGGPGGPGGPGKGIGMGIHGEFTTRAPGGGYQTLAHQVGEVTDVSASSVTVKSEDGFSRSYAVDDNTMVNAGNNGIGDVKKGDQVRVTAVVKDGKAAAVDIADMTQMRELRGKWTPERRKPGTAPPNGAPTS